MKKLTTITFVLAIPAICSSVALPRQGDALGLPPGGWWRPTVKVQWRAHLQSCDTKVYATLVYGNTRLRVRLQVDV